MFGGNAKTHFQVLGRPTTTTGYMMSPFGDERWDLDDKEKLKKIFKNHQMIDKLENNKRGEYLRESNISSQNNPNRMSLRSSQPPPKQRHHGYIHQSETALGYMPKSEIIQNYASSQPSVPQPNFTYPSRIESHNWHERPRFETVVGCLGPSSDQPVYSPVSVHSYYGVPQEAQVRNVRRANEVNSQKYVSRSQPEITDYCNYCTQWDSSKSSDAEYLQKSFGSPIWVPNTASPYRPFGPKEPTPSPYFPVPEKTVYMPLR